MKPLRLKHLIQTMAAESRLLRKESYRQQRRLREMICRQRMAAGGLTKQQIARILKKARGKMVTVYVSPDYEGGSGDPSMLVERHLWPASLNMKKCGFNDTDPEAPQQSWIDEKVAMISHLRGQRILMLRPSARAAQLAYAFLRGKSYADAENLGAETNEAKDGLPPHWHSIQFFARAYALVDGVQDAPMQAWIEEAKVYRTKHGLRNEVKEKDDDEGQAQDADAATG
jgi:hypothetical protein